MLLIPGALLGFAISIVSLSRVLPTLGRPVGHLKCHVEKVGKPRVVRKDNLLVQCVGKQAPSPGPQRNERHIIHGLF